MPTLRDLLTAELKRIPGIEEKIWLDHPGFVSFNYMGKEVAHFDTDHELGVKLTKNQIVTEKLEHPAGSTNHPYRYCNKPHWIVLPLKRKSRINQIVRLVKIATDQI